LVWRDDGLGGKGRVRDFEGVNLKDEGGRKEKVREYNKKAILRGFHSHLLKLN